MPSPRYARSSITGSSTEPLLSAGFHPAVCPHQNQISVVTGPHHGRFAQQRRELGLAEAFAVENDPGDAVFSNHRVAFGLVVGRKEVVQVDRSLRLVWNEQLIVKRCDHPAACRWNTPGGLDIGQHNGARTDWSKQLAHRLPRVLY